MFPSFRTSSPSLDYFEYAIIEFTVNLKGIQSVPWITIYQLERLVEAIHNSRSLMEIPMPKTSTIVLRKEISNGCFVCFHQKLPFPCR